MAKRTTPFSTGNPPATKPVASKSAPAATDRSANFKWWREGIEAIAVALILAFLIRTFEAEAFVIPTGSMAPTLYGRHKDLVCPKCGHRYQVGASEEVDPSQRYAPVVNTSCPMCLYIVELDASRSASDGSYTGDRIIVDKLAYEHAEPQRWQVVVFKYPGSAKQNYIKRLVGLPGETIRVYQGDLYVRPAGSQEFAIARKPPHTQWHMLQLVHDTEYVAPELVQAKFPPRWFAPADSGWTIAANQQSFTFEGVAPVWLRYQHLLPHYEDWENASQGRSVNTVNPFLPELISDSAAYNSRRRANEPDDAILERQRGVHWVGDLGLHADVELLSPTGHLLLDLVEGGRHFRCRINVTSGEASLSATAADGSPVNFGTEANGAGPSERIGATSIRGAGTHQIRFANSDDRLLLWVDDELVSFNGPTTYATPPQTLPHWSPSDPGDLHPIGISGEGTEDQPMRLQVNRLQVLRDIYYIAADTRSSNALIGFSRRAQVVNDYDETRSALGRQVSISEIFEVLATPQAWAESDLFRIRRDVKFELARPEDPARHQFFMLGDNSPESSDGRLWDQSPHYVERRLLIGRAVFVYWPHPLYVNAGRFSLPVFPNFPRMGLIH
ncbi:MAG: signal peptidase I [Pirellulales bacterium]